MLHAAFFCLLVGQVPPPPVPHPPESYQQSPSADPKAQREWLLDHLTADLQAQGTRKQRDQQRLGRGEQQRRRQYAQSRIGRRQRRRHGQARRWSF